LVSRPALVCVLASLTACTGRASDGSTNSSSTTTPAGQTDLTAAEIQYGVSPTRNNQVTYQDDVIVMEHGASDPLAGGERAHLDDRRQRH
jgi:hypothetical protein